MRHRLILPLLGLLVAAPVASQLTGSNGYYTVTVNAQGNYTAETGPLHPNAGFNVFYGPALGTSFNTLRIHDTARDLVFTTSSPDGSPYFCTPFPLPAAQSLIRDGGGNAIGVRNTWTWDDAGEELTIAQEVVAEGATLNESVVRVSLCATNDSRDPTSIGMRYLWDWQIGGFDGPFFAIRPPDPPVEPYLSREQAYADPAFESYDVSNTQDPSVNPPLYKVGGTVNGPPQAMGPTAPDLLQYVSWPSARATCFDYSAAGATAGGTGGPDSAVTYTWGASPATAIVLPPGETWCASQYAFAFQEEPVPICDVDVLAFGGVNCGGTTAAIDASSSTSTDCTGLLEFQFVDPDGAIFQDWSASASASADREGGWTVAARCSTDPACLDAVPIEVVLDQPPRLRVGSATDLAACNLGIHVDWDPATWPDAAGGTYDLHRSFVSCADALAQPPFRPDVPWGTVFDATATDGALVYYAIVAESATPARVCAPVGRHGGATASICIGPVAERADPTPPAHLCWPLRVGHVGDTVKLDWSLARPPLPDEHVHVLKAVDSAAGSFTLISAEPLVATTWTEADTSSTLQFFDVRYANSCEIESLDDEPPGWDPPPGVPCP